MNNQNIEIPDQSLAFSPKRSILITWIDQLLDHLRNGKFSTYYERTARQATKAGLYGLYLCAVLGLIVAIVFPIRYELSFGICLDVGVCWVIICIAAHYTAYKILPTIPNIVKNTPTKLSSRAFIDSFAVITGAICVISLLACGLVLWDKTLFIIVFATAVTTCIFSPLIISLCLNPKRLNIEITENTTAGEEFIGLCSFFMKCLLILIPVIFGAGIIFGILLIIGLLITPYTDHLELLVASTTTAAYLVLYSAATPIVGYISFIIYYFLIDLAASIMSIPTKLDLPKKENAAV